MRNWRTYKKYLYPAEKMIIKSLADFQEQDEYLQSLKKSKKEIEVQFCWQPYEFKFYVHYIHHKNGEKQRMILYDFNFMKESKYYKN